MASPTTGTSVAIRAPARAGSASIWAIRTEPASGRCLVYGKLVPTRNRVSISSIRSSDGLVPSSPIPPVVYGESSGTVALPDSVLTIGAASVSARASSSSRACSAPAPARIAIFFPSFRKSASRCRSSSRGRPGAGSRIAAVRGGLAGATCCHGSASASATWMSLGTVRCATPRRAYAVRTATSSTPGSWAGL